MLGGKGEEDDVTAVPFRSLTYPAGVPSPPLYAISASSPSPPSRSQPHPHLPPPRSQPRPPLLRRQHPLWPPRPCADLPFSSSSPCVQEASSASRCLISALSSEHPHALRPSPLPGSAPSPTTPAHASLISAVEALGLTPLSPAALGPPTYYASSSSSSQSTSALRRLPCLASSSLAVNRRMRVPPPHTPTRGLCLLVLASHTPPHQTTRYFCLLFLVHLRLRLFLLASGRLDGEEEMEQEGHFSD